MSFVTKVKDATSYFYESDDKKYGEAIFILHDVKTMYSRQVFSILDLLSILGGMSTVVFAIGTKIMY